MKIKQTILLFTAILSGAVFFLILVGIHPWAKAQDGGSRNDADTVSAVLKDNVGRQDCKARVMENYAMLSQPPGEDSVLTFQTVVDAELVDTTFGAASVSTFKVTMNSRRIQMESKDFTMIRDTSMLLLTLPSLQTIYLYKLQGEEDDHDPVAEMTEFLTARDELFAACSVVDCALEKDTDGSEYQKVILSPDPQTRRISGVKEFTVWLDTEKKIVHRVKLVPFYPAEYRQITWTFENLHRSLPPTGFTQPVETHVLADNGRLKSDYAGYTLEDNRLTTQ
ncbi:MAG: hypothetical protein AB7H80_07565 [Candidatus Kapaibacterium sp.]